MAGGCPPERCWETGSELVSPNRHWRTVMEHFAGIDVSLKQSSVCVVDDAGRFVRETKVASEPEALVRFFRGLGIGVTRIGLEAGPLSQWLHAGLVAAGFEVVLLETRHVKAALSAMVNKTDRKDARGIAQLLRMGWYRPVHCKTLPSQEVRAIITARKTLLSKLIDIELSMRGILRGFGLKVGAVTRKSFEIRVRELMAGQATLTTIMEGLLNARAALIAEVAKLHQELLKIARADGVCRRLMTVPGVGALTALTFKTAIDDPTRIAKSRDVGPLFGLTPGRYQSGETDIIGKITKVGDVMVRTALFEAATVMLTRSTKSSRLKAWALDLVKRRGTKRAIVALARKLGVVLHRIWVDGSTFRCATESAAMPALITAK